MIGVEFTPPGGWAVQGQGFGMAAFWWESSSWLTDGTSLLRPHMVEGVSEPSGVSLVRALIPSMRAPPSWPENLPRTLTPNYHHFWGLGLHHVNLGGDANIQTRALCYHVCYYNLNTVINTLEISFPSDMVNIDRCKSHKQKLFGVLYKFYEGKES